MAGGDQHSSPQPSPEAERKAHTYHTLLGAGLTASVLEGRENPGHLKKGFWEKETVASRHPILNLTVSITIDKIICPL
jgi:hypothetical protein